ncbi:MAG: 1-acyl-sn-glycerol-3-phosphate acyltransferase [Clostridiales bacterium]|nr:1-acyl-sn-glycerol-3-phosphate acyltransferase [Clostridiales bacterium]
MIPEEYIDIAPYEDNQFQEKMSQLVKEPGFEHAVRYVMPDVDYDAFSKQLLSVKTKHDFQRNIMLPFLDMLVMKTTSGVESHGFEHLDIETPRTYITNHRDIVLDASFLNLCLVKHNHHTCEIALGNNLLVYSWIEDLVKLNKSFIVKRNLKVTKALEAARQLSGYMHYCISTKHESTWIAQREGRAKDSNDLTQESLIKMLTLAGPKSPVESLKALNITPVSITYEYDPCDYLKATEYLNKRRDPDYHKTERDDLKNMETGILGFKGRVVFNAGSCINPSLGSLDENADRQQCIHAAATAIDHMIHRGYHIFPGNYIAYDRVEETPRFKALYTDADIEKFDKYINGQLGKVELTDVTPEEREYMRNIIYSMYANPLRNKLVADQR